MRTAYYEHHTQAPKGLFERWPNFKPYEIASKGDGSILIDFEAMDKLQRARELAGKPMRINSAYRDEMHNALIGGAPRSYHLEGKAFDVSLQGFSKPELLRILRRAGFTGLGINYNSFVHADTGRKREW